MPTITLTIDDRAVTVPAGTTVLEAAARAGAYVPTLCHHEALPPLGTCGLCAVEVAGQPGAVPACATAAADGMVVRTETPALSAARVAALEGMLSRHADPCVLCDYRAECGASGPYPTEMPPRRGPERCPRPEGLTVRRIRIDRSRLPWAPENDYSLARVEGADPFIERDYNLCIDCGLCWRACEQVHGPGSAEQTARRPRSAAAEGHSWVVGGCRFCGACVDVCPAGAISDRAARWYEPSRYTPTTVCTLCPQTCAMRAVVANGHLVATAMPRLDRDARLCALGRFGYPQLLNQPGRLTLPQIRKGAGGALAAVDWDEAIEAIATALVRYRDGTFAVVLGRTDTRENAMIYELFARHAMRGRVVRVDEDTYGASSELLRREIGAGAIRAAMVAGALLDAEAARALDYLVVLDFRPSPASAAAHAVLPVAVLAELEGSVQGADGRVVRLKKVVEPPPAARAEWTVLSDLAVAMGVDLGRARDGWDNGPPPEPSDSLRPRDSVRDLPRTFRGHLVADVVPELRTLGLPFGGHPAGERT